MFDDTLTQILFLAVCHILALLAFLILLMIFINRLVRKKNNPNRREKVIAIAITCIIYNVTLQNIIVRPIQILVENTQNLFYLYTQYADAGATISDPVSVQQFKNNHPLTAITVKNIFDNFSLARLLSAIAITVLLYFIIRNIKTKLSEQKQEQVPKNNNALLYNYIITAILTLSLFLIISVCITIPYLSEISKPTAFTKERLDSALKPPLNIDSFQVIGNPPFADTFNVETVILKDTVGQYYSNLPVNKRSGINDFITQLQKQVDQSNQERKELKQSLDEYKKEYNSGIEDFRRRLLLNFENATRSLTIDKGDLFASLVNRFYDYTNSSRDNYNLILQQIRQTDENNSFNFNASISKIQNVIERSYQDSAYLPYSGNDLSIILYADHYPKFYPDIYYNAYIPPIENDGSNWGFFGFIARYLIKTQSSDLVVLMGMFGFGLLGASLFSFSKSDDSKNFVESFRTRPLISNFGSVLARGFGAALVVYLAAKGGLAIFSAGTATDANGYILLLSCFVGAVFSEKVWNKIKNNFYGGGDNNNGKGANNNDDNNKPNGNTGNGEKQQDVQETEDDIDESVTQEMIAAQNMQQLKMAEDAETEQGNTT